MTVAIVVGMNIRLVSTAAAGFTASAVVGLACAAPAAAYSHVDFASPSGNLYCSIYTGDDGASVVRCGANGATYAAPTEIARGPGQVNCGGPDLTMALGSPAVFHCVSDSVINTNTLPYGRSITASGFTCTSLIDGIHCSGGGHSFRYARDSYDI